MNIKYNRLFNLSITHEYYKNGINEDVKLKPDSKTKELLANGKLLFKTLGNSFIVLYKAASDNISPFIDLGKDVNFRFYITVERSDEFLNITKLDTSNKYVAGNKVYFSNDPTMASSDKNAPEILNHILVDKAFGKLFTYSFSLSTNHTKTKLEVENDQGQLVSIGKDTDGNDLPTTIELTREDLKVFNQQIDLRNKPAGIYKIIIKNMAGDIPPLREETVLIDNEAINQGVLGVLDIKYNTASNHMYGDTEFYRLQFDRKSTFWKYFIINKSNNIDLSIPATSLSIEDSISGGGTAYVNVNFIREGDEPHLTTKIKGYDTVIFKSDDTIPIFEEPKLNVALRLQPEDKVLVDHLPNPPFNTVEKENGGDIEKEIFVFI
ncbi:hypothetical protein D1818_23245 [Aquimarina sp. BL5]|uniref:hypothetical protein n=1 Tax=Aquimarina sp. BL5 TaxID=1714860 RepID=UPI000E5269DD|nr:hypothetical protein [Aquimarina sp. BL5]AXT53598.1 hypothetical protein D1818_23245 [Aquimarina sp. BL5]RKN03869.1 hypothetical protein D7036_13025 [Aquimarina sp. BL5]